MAAHAPALRKDALSDASWDAARRDWANRSSLLASHGRALVRSGAIPYASAFASAERVETLVDALERGRRESTAASAARAAGDVVEAPAYVFEQIRWDGDGGGHPLADFVRSRVGKLEALNDMEIHDAQFFVGDAYTDGRAEFCRAL